MGLPKKLIPEAQILKVWSGFWEPTFLKNLIEVIMRKAV
jgi:hypothetical protein